MGKAGSRKYTPSRFSLEAKKRLAPEKVQELLRRYKASLLPKCIVDYFQIDKWEEVGPWGWHAVEPEDEPPDSPYAPCRQVFKTGQKIIMTLKIRRIVRPTDGRVKLFLGGFYLF